VVGITRYSASKQTREVAEGERLEGEMAERDERERGRQRRRENRVGWWHWWLRRWNPLRLLLRFSRSGRKVEGHSGRRYGRATMGDVDGRLFWGRFLFSTGVGLCVVEGWRRRKELLEFTGLSEPSVLGDEVL